MYTKRRYSQREVIKWTKRETRFFLISSTLVTVLIVVLDLKWLQLPFTPVGLIGTAVAFLIGFQNNAAYGRIWEARKIWGGIVNTSRTLIITVRDGLNLEKNKVDFDEQKEIKTITHRHVAWLTALRFAMRQKKSWETDYKSKHNKKWHDDKITPEWNSTLEEELKPYLSTEEYEYVMSKNNKPNAIIGLQSKHFRQLSDAQVIWHFSFLEYEKLLQELTALQGKSERIKNFPYPRQYATIGYDFVHLFIMILPFAIIPSFISMGAKIELSHPLIGQFFVWLNIPFSAAVAWVFNTMLRIGLAGENPFEGSPNDVPISTISVGISRDILELIDENEENMPKQFTNERQIQM